LGAGSVQGWIFGFGTINGFGTLIGCSFGFSGVGLTGVSGCSSGFGITMGSTFHEYIIFLV